MKTLMCYLLACSDAKKYDIPTLPSTISENLYGFLSISSVQLLKFNSLVQILRFMSVFAKFS